MIGWLRKIPRELVIAIPIIAVIHHFQHGCGYISELAYALLCAIPVGIGLAAWDKYRGRW